MRTRYSGEIDHRILTEDGLLLPLCNKCGKNPVAGWGSSIKCHECLVKDREYRQNLRMERFKKGLCPECGKRPLDRFGYVCSYCLEHRKEMAHNRSWDYTQNQILKKLIEGNGTN